VASFPYFSTLQGKPAGFIIPSINGYKRIRNRGSIKIWKTRHRISVDIRIFFTVYEIGEVASLSAPAAMCAVSIALQLRGTYASRPFPDPPSAAVYRRQDVLLRELTALYTDILPSLSLITPLTRRLAIPRDVRLVLTFL